MFLFGNIFLPTMLCYVLLFLCELVYILIVYIVDQLSYLKFDILIPILFDNPSIQYNTDFGFTDSAVPGWHC